MNSQPASIPDMEIILLNLDDESRNEIELAGFDLKQARHFLVERIQCDQADALRHDGKLLAIISWFVEGLAVTTSFVATSAFFDPGVPSVRFGRRYMRALQQRFRGHEIISYSYSGRESARRWFELMGFTLASEKDGSKIFRFGP